MKAASIFKLSHGYIIHSLSRTIDGLHLASSPYIILGNDATIEEVVQKILLALKASQEGIPRPTDWTKSNKDFLNAIGLKSGRELEKKDVKYCGIRMDNNKIFFTSSRHADPPDKGFLHKPAEEEVSVSVDAGIELIGNALADAFSKCE